MNNNWQLRILPFAIVVILLLILIFFSFYIYQITQIQDAFSNVAEYNNGFLKQLLYSAPNGKQTETQQLYNAEIITLLNRHHSASMIIKSRILIISLSFLTGVVMAFLGSIFIIGKFSEKDSAIEGSSNQFKLVIASSSPGIIVTTLGVILISIAILSKTDLQVFDKPVYIQRYDSDVFERPATATDSAAAIELERLTIPNHSPNK